MRLSRRSLIVGSAAAIGVGVVATRGVWDARTAPAPQALRFPKLIDVRKQGNSVSLQAGAGRTDFFPGQVSRTLGYNGNYLGPTLRVHRGDEVKVAVTNALSEDTSVHWHGLLIPAKADGGPHQLIRPGDTWRPILSIQQPAATLFYHSHVHGRTGVQVYSGLAGMLLVTDEEEQALGLPSDYGVDDLPLLLQDRLFEDGQLVTPAGMMALMEGRRGNATLVNGTPNAVARVPAGLVRLRLVNGSNANLRSFLHGPAHVSMDRHRRWAFGEPRCAARADASARGTR